jgi:hypothetical protein
VDAARGVFPFVSNQACSFLRRAGAHHGAVLVERTVRFFIDEDPAVIRDRIRDMLEDE